MSERLVPIPSELLTTHCQKCNRMIPVKTSLHGICHKCYGIKSKWDQPIWYCDVCDGLFTKYELKGGMCFQCRENTKEGNLSKQRQLQRTEAQSAAEDYKDYLYDCQSKGTCDILHMHHHILQDDPERLSTKFIQDLIKGHEHTEEEKLVLNLPEEFIEVNLTKGYTTFISKEDLEILNRAWHVSINKESLNATSSIKTDKGVRKVMMHRVIMARILGRELNPKEYVVHIDRNSLNNTRDNLMVCSAKQLGQHIHRTAFDQNL